MNVKRMISFVSVMAVCSLTMTSMAQGKQGSSHPETWTVMLYVAADNDLEMYWEGASLAALLNLPSTDAVTFVAYVDLMSTQGTQIIEVDGADQQVLETLEEKNFADAETLEWALSDVAER